MHLLLVGAAAGVIGPLTGCREVAGLMLLDGLVAPMTAEPSPSLAPSFLYYGVPKATGMDGCYENRVPKGVSNGCPLWRYDSSRLSIAPMPRGVSEVRGKKSSGFSSFSGSADISSDNGELAPDLRHVHFGVRIEVRPSEPERARKAEPGELGSLQRAFDSLPRVHRPFGTRLGVGHQ